MSSAYPKYLTKYVFVAKFVLTGKKINASGQKHKDVAEVGEVEVVQGCFLCSSATFSFRYRSNFDVLW